MKKIKEILIKNISLKLLSFFLAALIWVSIMNFDDPYITETINGIKVEAVNEKLLGDSFYEIENGKTVSITVRAPRSVIDNLKNSDFTAVVDFTQLSYVNAVPINVFLNSNSKYTEYDVKILTQSPVMMTLTMEERVEDLFNIETIVTGEAKDGYYINNIKHEKLVTVKATSRQLAKINRIVLNIDVTDVEKSFSMTSVPIAYDENGDEIDSSYIIYEYPEMQIDIEVLPTKDIHIIATKEGEPPEGYVCTGFQIPAPMTVKIAGTAKELDSIASYFIITINVEGFTSSEDYTVNIEDALKQKFWEMNYIVLDNKTMNVRIKIEQLEEKDIMVNTSLIELRNVAEGLHAKFLMETELKVKIKGISSIIENITADSLKLYVDMQGKESGTHYMYISSETKAEFDVNSPVAVIEVYQNGS